MRNRALRDVAIAGIGETDVGAVPGKSARDLETEAVNLALADAGIDFGAVDSILTFLRWDSGWETKAPIVADRLGISPVLPSTLAFGGTSSTALLYQGALLVATGMAETVVVVSADTQLSNRGRRETMSELVTGTADPQYEIPFGANNPGLYAQYASRHMHEYGTTSEQLAQVAVTFREHARLNPKAQMKAELTVEDVLASRMIASPFHLYDCAVISDGGFAFVITTAERAKNLRQTPIFFEAAAEAHYQNWISHMSSLTHTAASVCAERAFGMAGISPKDIDVLFLSDQFTITPILQLEDLGFCKKGEGGPFAASGELSLGGSLPTNTHGGLLSYCHPGKGQCYAHVVEAVRQLRGTAGVAQVPGASYSYIHAVGGTLSAHVSLILSNVE